MFKPPASSGHVFITLDENSSVRKKGAAGRLPWAILAAAVVVIAGILGGALSPPVPAWVTREVWTNENRPVALAGGVPEYTGFENIYIMAHGKYNQNENLSGNENIVKLQGQPAVIEGDGWNVSIPYETRFDIVPAARGKAPENMAYAAKENIRVHLVLSGAFSLDEYSPDNKKFVYENQGYGSPNGWLRLNFVFDNNGDGFVLRAGNSLNWTATLECWK